MKDRERDNPLDDLSNFGFLGLKNNDYSSAVLDIGEVAGGSSYSVVDEFSIRGDKVDTESWKDKISLFEYVEGVLSGNGFDNKARERDQEGIDFEGIVHSYDGEMGRVWIQREEQPLKLAYLLFEEGFSNDRGIRCYRPNEDAVADYHTELNSNNLEELWDIIKFDNEVAKRDYMEGDVNTLENSSA